MLDDTVANEKYANDSRLVNPEIIYKKMDTINES